MPEVPVRIVIFGHADALRQENNNTFRFGKGETLATSSSWKKERDLTSHKSDRAFESIVVNYPSVKGGLSRGYILLVLGILCAEVIT